MMPYTVVWDEDLERDFANAWVEAGPQLRSFLTWATNELDHSLKRRPDEAGQPVPQTPYRILLVSDGWRVLEAVFHVLPDDRLVRVINVRLKGLTP